MTFYSFIVKHLLHKGTQLYFKTMKFRFFCTEAVVQEVFCKKGVLRNFAKFTLKHLWRSLRPAALFKKRLWRRCFPDVNFVKLLRINLFNRTLLVASSVFNRQTLYKEQLVPEFHISYFSVFDPNAGKYGLDEL